MGLIKNFNDFNLNENDIDYTFPEYYQDMISELGGKEYEKFKDLQTEYLNFTEKFFVDIKNNIKELIENGQMNSGQGAALLAELNFDISFPDGDDHNIDFESWLENQKEYWKKELKNTIK